MDGIGQAAVDATIGVEPSGEAFNEISVDETTKKPKNPMINAGAIAAVSLIPASTPDERFALIRDFYSGFAGRRLELDDAVYASERRPPAAAIARSPTCGIGVYSPLLDANGNSVRGVRLCRSLSEQLGRHFLTVARGSRATLRAVYEPREGIRVYETHGDLSFSGAEQVARTADRDREDFTVAILDVSRSDDIDDAARELLSGLSTALRAQGKAGYLVDPDGIVIRTESQHEAFRYDTVGDAVAAAEERLRDNRI